MIIVDRELLGLQLWNLPKSWGGGQHWLVFSFCKMIRRTFLLASQDVPGSSGIFSAQPKNQPLRQVKSTGTA